jgi:hypothetical protein
MDSLTLCVLLGVVFDVRKTVCCGRGKGMDGVHEWSVTGIKACYTASDIAYVIDVRFRWQMKHHLDMRRLN